MLDSYEAGSPIKNTQSPYIPQINIGPQADGREDPIESVLSVRPCVHLPARPFVCSDIFPESGHRIFLSIGMWL